jgi:hypothetical protein
MPHSARASNNHYPEPNQPILRIDTYFFKIHSNTVLPSTCVPVNILKALLPSSISTKCPAHLHLLDIIVTILGERYKLWSSSLWSLLHSLFATLLGPNVCLMILFPNTLSLAWCVPSRFGWGSRPPNMDVSCQYKLNKQSRKADQEWSLNLGVWHKANNLAM